MTYFEPFKISINGLQGGVPYIPLIGTVLRETIRGSRLNRVLSCNRRTFGNQETPKHKQSHLSSLSYACCFLLFSSFLTWIWKNHA